MTLLQEVRYERKIKKLRDIPPNQVPEEVLSMLRDVRADIGKLDSSFTTVGLARVLEVVRSGKYELNGSVSTRIDLSSAKSVIDAYKKYSEGGCQSCVSLGKETINAQDATSGWYCQISDPDFNKDARGDQLGVRYAEFSPKIKKHYENPCGDWRPRFSPTLEKLVE